MAFLEISPLKIWTMFKEEIKYSESEDTAERLMKFALSTAKKWDTYAISPNTLKRVKSFVDSRLEEMGEIWKRISPIQIISKMEYR